MNFTDTHTHLYSEEFNEDRVQIIENAINAGVTKMLLPNVDSKTINGLMTLSSQFPDNCFPMMGLHPCSVSPNYISELGTIYNQLKNGSKYYAVGEIGIDLYWDKTLFDEQAKAFMLQCQWALDLGLPIAIHTRNATRETIDCLKQMPKQPGGVFHCFSGTLEEANEVIEMGYKLGIGGVVTFKNSALPNVLKQIDLQHILLETDAPYLSPEPYRGKRNESAYVPFVARKLVEIYTVSIEDIAMQTTANALSVFKI